MGVQLANSIYSILLSAYYAAVIPLAVLLVRHRNEQPIKGRGWVFTIIATMGGMMMFTVISFRQPDPTIFACSLYVVASNLFFSIFFLPYIFRAFKVLYIQYVTLVMSDDDDGAKRVMYDRKRRFSDYCNVFFFFIAVVISLIVSLWMVYFISVNHDGIKVYDAANNNGTIPMPATSSEVIDMMHVGCAFGGEFVPFALISVGYITAFIIFYVLLRRVKEDLAGSCRELRWCLSLWIPCTIAFFVCNLWEPLFWLDDIIPFSTWILFIIAGTNMISLLQPVMQTYSPVTGATVSRMEERAQVNSYERIENILKDPVARDIFNRWMVEKSADDIFFFEFLKDVRIYKDRSPADRWKYSLQIKNTYLERDSPSSITEYVIAHHMKIFNDSWSACQQRHAAPRPLFDQIAIDIIKYLQENKMLDFVRSDLYRKELIPRTSLYHASLDAYQDHGLVSM